MRATLFFFVIALKYKQSKSKCACLSNVSSNERSQREKVCRAADLVELEQPLEWHSEYGHKEGQG